MKRHIRPYGCTFESCHKTFGSKNDWKRHENFHLETWRCSLPHPSITSMPPPCKSSPSPASGESALIPDTHVCAKLTYRRPSFFAHLQSAHVSFCSTASKAQIDAKIDECRIGRNCQARFWCGFCKSLIELKKKSLDAWNERFDHIDNHFMGKNGHEQKNIKDWIPVDKMERRGSLSPDKESSGSFSESGYGFSGSNSPEHETSPTNAIDLESPPSPYSKRRRISDSDEEPRPSKQTKRAVTVVYCVSILLTSRLFLYSQSKLKIVQWLISNSVNAT
jgi:hypothetical protein